MIRTRVGYSGGTTKDPTYHRLGDHAETVEIDFDPASVSYDKLLALFWTGHDPSEAPWKRQYMSAVFHHDEAQKRLAEESRTQAERRLGRKVHTEILPAGPFHRAEDYHQKHYLRMEGALFRELGAAYPDPRDLADSTAAARANGYVGGFGSTKALEAEIDRLGLSPAGKERLREIVGAREARRVGGGPFWAPCPID